MNLLDLSPWDQLPYITSVKETALSSAPPGTSLALANNQRIAIGFSCTSGGTGATVTTRSGTVTGGLSISGNNPLLWITAAQFYTLPTLQWFGTSSAAITIIEIIAAAWPQDGDNYLDAIARPPVPIAKPQFSSAPGVSGDNGVLSYWQSLMKRIRGQ